LVVFAASTFAATVEADCFTAATPVLHLGFTALLASCQVAASSPTSGSVSSSTSTEESDS
jgi:hypothetical protein